MLFSVFLGQVYEQHAHRVAYATRAAVQHDPDTARLIQANLDKVIAAAQGSHMAVIVGVFQARVGLANRIELIRQLPPCKICLLGRGFP